VSGFEHSNDDDFRQYAETIRDLRISHEAGHAVLAEHFSYELFNLSLDASIVSPEGATGGAAEIQFRMYHKRADFDNQLQNIATVLMGGRAAEELTYPHLARDSHWQMDIFDFKGRVAEFRSDAEMDALLHAGYRRAKTLLSTTEISEQHHRLRNFLATEPLPHQPNGRFLSRVMKGLSS
jgi:hypothetical protein